LGSIYISYCPTFYGPSSRILYRGKLLALSSDISLEEQQYHQQDQQESFQIYCYQHSLLPHPFLRLYRVRIRYHPACLCSGVGEILKSFPIVLHLVIIYVRCCCDKSCHIHILHHNASSILLLKQEGHSPPPPSLCRGPGHI